MWTFYQVFQGKPTLYIIDDSSATKVLTRKKCMLYDLAFNGRHAMQSVWFLTQKNNSVLKYMCEQMHWVAAILHCKNRDSFEDCLQENDLIPSGNERVAVRQFLAVTKHAK